MSGLPLRPVITYGSPPTVLSLFYPQKLWGYNTHLEGDSHVLAQGRPEAFVVRQDDSAMLTLRVHDCELLDVRTWIMAMMRGGTFEFQFDALDTMSVFTCYLDAPTFQDGFKPRRMAGWPDIWEVDITIRASEALVPVYYSFAQACEINSTVLFNQGWILTNFANGSNFRLIIGSTPATFGSALQLSNFPDPIVDNIFRRSSAPEGIWDTLILTAGIVVPQSVFMESQGPTGTTVWQRMGSNFTIKHMRDGVTLAEYTSADMGSGSLVTSWVEYDVSGIGPLFVQEGDVVRLELNGYIQLQVDATDDEFRNTYYYGAVFGPRISPYMSVRSNVQEIP